MLRRCGEECAEAGLVFDDDLAGVYVEQAFGLQAHEVARDEFAHGAELAGEFLVAHGQLKFDSLRSLLALGLCETQKQGDEALANGGEGQLLDDADETAQTRRRRRPAF